MGYYQDLFNKILVIEGQGFDPYKDNYGARIGQLDAQSTPVPESSDNPSMASTDPQNATPEPTLSERYISEGYDDPLSNLTTPGGDVNFPQINKAYRVAVDNPNLGVDPVDLINKINEDSTVKDYYEAPIQVSPDGSLILPRKKDNRTWRYEKSFGSDKREIYSRFDKDENAESFSSKEEYDESFVKDYEAGKLEKTKVSDEYYKKIIEDKRKEEERLSKMKEEDVQGINKKK